MHSCPQPQNLRLAQNRKQLEKEFSGKRRNTLVFMYSSIFQSKLGFFSQLIFVSVFLSWPLPDASPGKKDVCVFCI
jgi:hypothetical protein